MLLSWLICNILFIPFTFGNVTNVGIDKSGNKGMIAKENLESQSQTNKTVNSTIIITEGGVAVPSTPLILSNQNAKVLLSLEEEVNKEKSVQSTGSRIRARNGVKFQPDNSTTADTAETKQVNDTVTDKALQDTHITVSVSKSTQLPNLIPQSNNKENKTMIKLNVTVEKIQEHKKPLILSNEGLDKMDQIQTIRMPVVQSSSKTLIHDQMPSPNQSAYRKTMQAATSKLIMPIVITILVVPMFAVLGYMTLRRGQEAWKNRHYKRMDFLLDGMYNE